METFPRAEVLKHNTASDCWLIIQNCVYDFSPFIKEHPGGMDILLARAGEDATSYFITKHGNNKTVLKRLEQYKIGLLPENERITANDFDEPFLMELIDKIYRAKLYQVPKWFRNPLFWVRTVNITLFFGFSYLALYAGLSWWLCILLVAAQAVIGTSLFGLVAHENTHRNYPHSSFGRFLLRISWSIFFPFISQNPLRYEHNSHHIKIGDPDYDYEVAAFADVVRYSGHVEHTAVHAKQHKLAKLLYPFYANIITTVGGVSSGFWKKHNRKVGVEHTLSVLWTLTVYVVIPSAIMGNVWWYVLLYMVYQCVLFYGIYVGAAINHFVPSAALPIPDEHKNKYAYYVCRNTTNFASDSAFWFWYTGGFNVQLEHHLIPFVPVENLRKMIPIVRELCVKYNYPYVDYKNFLSLWNDHYSYLFMLAENRVSVQVNNEILNKTNYQAR